MFVLANKLLGIKVQNVPIADIRHSDRDCYVQEGHGGQPVEKWPIFEFFSSYMQGEEEGAATRFELWYREQFERYRDVPKRKGGMRNGSLARMVRRFESSVPGTVGNDQREDMEQCLVQAITARVRQRFELLQSINERGYQTDGDDPILGIRRDDGVYLVRGHHRIAVLAALGHKECSDVLTFPGKKCFFVWSWVRTLNNLIGRCLNRMQSNMLAGF